MINSVEIEHMFSYEESIPLWIIFIVYESKLDIADLLLNEDGFRFNQDLKVRMAVTAAWTKEEATKLGIEAVEDTIDNPRNSYMAFSLFEYLSLFKKEKEVQESIAELVDKYLPDK